MKWSPGFTSNNKIHILIIIITENAGKENGKFIKGLYYKQPEKCLNCCIIYSCLTNQCCIGSLVGEIGRKHRMNKWTKKTQLIFAIFTNSLYPKTLHDSFSIRYTFFFKTIDNTYNCQMINLKNILMPGNQWS